MDDIETFKQGLTKEIVFYNLSTHELSVNESVDSSVYNKYEGCNSIEELMENITNNNKKRNSNSSKIIKTNEYGKNGDDIEYNKSVNNNEINNSHKNKICNITKKEENVIYKKDDKYNNSYKYYKCDENKNIGSSSSYCSCLSFSSEKCYTTVCDFIKEIKPKNYKQIKFIPLVNILYNYEKVIFLFYISGNVQNFNVTINNNNVTISGVKVPYEIHKCNNYYSNEIQMGYFERIFNSKIPLKEAPLSYEYKNGIMEICAYFVSNQNM
ncbi:conserved protein, unknown function [Hepatocystis sp. ex Piliocolobus tephrosceles]|nr:conserved protein, unknown function [Hepatocystis sp. ex Piliocolobus tephrosceles]